MNEAPYILVMGGAEGNGTYLCRGYRTANNRIYGGRMDIGISATSECSQCIIGICAQAIEKFRACVWGLYSTVTAKNGEYIGYVETNKFPK